MKVILWIIGIIGLLIVLSIGSCIGLIYFASSGVPEYVTIENINKIHGNDIAIVQKELETNKEITMKSFKTNKLKNIYAIMIKVKIKGKMSKYKTLYPNNNISLKNYMVANGSGYGTLNKDGQKIPVVIYEFNKGDDRYRLLLKDWGPGNKK
ncbi:MAG: hypothetical protein COA79_13150 [Planctomycetota bacterium]|nr:MAG: hypothetical protein COA79_13150 [Planctomycetota bacterium]